MSESTTPACVTSSPEVESWENEGGAALREPDCYDTPEPAPLPHTLLLPPNLAKLGLLAAKGETARYTMIGVRLRQTTDGYRVEATNGRFAGLVEGTSEDASNYPELPSLASAPNSGTDVLVPGAAWAEAFKLIPKNAAKLKPILGNVAAVISEKRVTFATTDLEHERSLGARTMDGRFPDLDLVIPGGEPLARVRLTAALLVELLKVAAEFSGEDGPIVTLELRSPTTPVVIRSKNKTQTFTGVLMPVS